MTRAGIGAPIEPESELTAQMLRVARQRKNQDLIYKVFKRGRILCKPTRELQGRRILGANGYA